MNSELLQQMLQSNPNGAKAAANLDDIMRKVNIVENKDSINKIKNNLNAEKAKAGDATAMSALLKDLVTSKEGQDLIAQVKKATE
ncbi:MAG: hypothetical protein FWE06_02550 [Oscillospiraceae bacterium]|nr:hypothetical protein [Oscillospiraceae bacterium]